MLARDTLWLLLAPLFAPACGGTASHTRFADPATLLAERDEWRGERGGNAALRLHVEVLVDTRSDPSKAESALNLHFVVAQFGSVVPGGDIPLAFPVPRGARLGASEVRRVAADGSATKAALVIPPTTHDGNGVDPEQVTVAITLPQPSENGVVEAILRFDVAGTLAADARWLGLVGMPVAELLLRYDLASDTVGSFQTTLPNARPVVTEKDGRRLIALLATNLPAIGDTKTAPTARYVTVKASPKGYDQSYATDWSNATRDYVARLLGVSDGLSEGYAVPYTPIGSGRAAALDALAWVRSRPMRTDPFAVRWDAARKLPDVIAKNDLNALDRVHLLHWILREAKVPHAFLMARAAARPPLDPAFPTPGAFDLPLIWFTGLPEHALVLDPACDQCAPGTVRPALAGGQAIALPVTPPGARAVTFIDLEPPSTP